jgi:hypothetical protein
MIFFKEQNESGVEALNYLTPTGCKDYIKKLSDLRNLEGVT